MANKKIVNSSLLGRKGVTLKVLNETGIETEFKAFDIIKLAAFNIPKEEMTMEGMRKANKILDKIEMAEEAGNAEVEIDEDMWKFLRPTIETIVVKSFSIHAPYVIDQLSA